jgi:UDP-N-acetylglucosamine 2-epimerase (non-hydrolysing)
MQEETTYLRVPCLTLRSTTERPVTTSAGTNTVVGEDLERAEALVRQILSGEHKVGSAIPGWDGEAAERVADALVAAWA